jgi:hypothetical protein
MQSRDFCYWLQGFFEVASMTQNEAIKPEVCGLSAAQISMIRNHLNMVFVHEIDPAMGDKAHQAKLNETHGAVGGQPSGPVLYRC